MSISIQAPVDTDRKAWERLYRCYAEFYQAPMNAGILETVWGWICDSDTDFHCRLAWDSETGVVGLMHFRPVYSSFRGAATGYLDDLYVTPAARGLGAVDRLFEDLTTQARQRGWEVVRWITRDNNYRARGVYDRVALRTDWVTYELHP